MIPRCWPALVALALSMRLCGPEPAHAGTLVCDATCLSKAASISSIALNADKVVTGSKYAKTVITHPFHPRKALERAKIKAAKRTNK